MDTVKFALPLPDVMVTVDGSEEALLLSVSVTTAPVDGATPFRVAVPVDDVPPTTLVGLSAMVESLSGFTVRVAEAVAL